MKKLDQIAFVAFLSSAIVSLGIAIYCWVAGSSDVSKWLATSGLVTTVAGVMQLEVSGLFKRVIEHYSDEQTFPYGPPPAVTREIIDNPDAPLRMWVRSIFFFNLRTGFWLIVVGTLLQVGAVWL